MTRILLVALSTLAAAPLAAQQPPTIPRPGPSRLRLAIPVVVDTVKHQRPVHETYALRGAVIGAFPFVLLALGVLPAFCEDTDSNGEGHDCTLRGFLKMPLIAAPGGFIGAMIGAASPKSAKDIWPSKGSYWREAAIGLGGFGVIGGALLGHRDCRADRQTECTSQALTGALTYGLVNGALGGMLGALIPKR